MESSVVTDEALPKLRSFQSIYETAVLHKGGAVVVEAGLPVVLTEKQLGKIPNSEYLSQMSRRVFRAGLKHSMVDAKWPAFESVFHGFDLNSVAMMSDEDLEGLMHDKRIIRHFGKIKSVRKNAIWLLDIVAEHGSVGEWLAQWPADNIVGLWTQLKKYGTQMGGHSGARFLRMVGKDTFLLTDDVVAVLKAEGIVDKIPTSQKALSQVQLVFNQWQAESGRSMAEISRIISFTTNSN